MAQHRNTVSCDQERAWLASTDSGSRSCFDCHQPQIQIGHCYDRSHLREDGLNHTFPVKQIKINY